MSGDEVFVAMFAAACAAYYWGYWLFDAFHTSPLVRPGGRQSALILCFVACHVVVLAALLTGADPVVRRSLGYIFLFLAVEAVTLAVVNAAGTLIGLSALDNAVRRPNIAAVWAIGGLWLGASISVAGANLGRGATIWTTVGPLVIAQVIHLVLLALFAVGTGGMSSVRLDRDVSSGVRLAGLHVAWGLVLGRAAAGDWESIPRTAEDFIMQGWPTLALLGLAIPLDRLLRPSRRHPAPPAAAGFGPALAYVALAAIWVVYLGPPVGFHR